ncbi:MAG: hypothetical protein Q7T45_06435, partial [Bradyrhizobium sp.]|uniref:hypothetical protein n=1 Tax=Bradyrhizobium sp. TaxID=376 RepID=UPI00271CE066
HLRCPPRVSNHLAHILLSSFETPRQDARLLRMRTECAGAALAAISFRLRLTCRFSLRIADGLGEHLAQLSLGLRRFLREGFLPLCHLHHMGMAEGELNPRSKL